MELLHRDCPGFGTPGLLQSRALGCGRSRDGKGGPLPPAPSRRCPTRPVPHPPPPPLRRTDACGRPDYPNADFGAGTCSKSATTCTAPCGPGYLGHVTAVCHDPVWEYRYGGTRAADCLPVSCGPPSQPHVDFTACRGEWAFGGACRPTCEQWYVGAPTAVCGANGAWVYGGECAYSPALPAPPPGSGCLAQMGGACDDPLGCGPQCGVCGIDVGRFGSEAPEEYRWGATCDFAVCPAAGGRVHVNRSACEAGAACFAACAPGYTRRRIAECRADGTGAYGGECERACWGGYAPAAGRGGGPGWDAPAADCRGCAAACDADGECRAYACGAAGAGCTLHNGTEPAAEPAAEAVLCAPGPPWCAPGYVPRTGTIQGPLAEGDAVSDCAPCAALCDGDPDCAAYACGANGTCRLHDSPDADPESNVTVCARLPPRLCAAGFAPQNLSHSAQPPNAGGCAECAARCAGDARCGAYACGAEEGGCELGPAAAAAAPGAVHCLRAPAGARCGVPRHAAMTFQGCDRTPGGRCAAACRAEYTGTAAATCGADGLWVFADACVPRPWLHVDARGAWYVTLPAGNTASRGGHRTHWHQLRIRGVVTRGMSEVAVSLSDAAHATAPAGAGPLAFGTAEECRAGPDAATEPVPGYTIDLRGTPFRLGRLPALAPAPGPIQRRADVRWSACRDRGKVCEGGCRGGCAVCGLGPLGLSDAFPLAVDAPAVFDAGVPALAPAPRGCWALETEGQCLGAYDGRAGEPFYGQRCEWCCGAACTPGGHRCEPRDWLLGHPQYSGRSRDSLGGSSCPAACGAPPGLPYAELPACASEGACAGACRAGYTGRPVATCEADGAWRYEGRCTRCTDAHWADLAGHACGNYTDNGWCAAAGGPGPGRTTADFATYARGPHSALDVCCGCRTGERRCPHAVELAVGPSDVPSKVLRLTEPVLSCAPVCGRGCRTNADDLEAGDAFLVTVVAGGVAVDRIDAAAGWQMDLRVQCCLPCEGGFRQDAAPAPTGTAGQASQVVSCAACAALCLAEDACVAYECSGAASAWTCRLHSAHTEGGAGDATVCARRDCGPPTVPPHAVTHNCSHRYAGAPAAVCTSDGTWHYAGTCVPISCGAPRMDYVDFGGCGHRYGGLCRPACQTGYTGAPTAVCSSDGSWTYEGACERIRCSPPFMEHVDFSDCEFGYGAACHPVCVSGYTGNPAAVCTATGRWDYLGSCQPDVPTYENAVAFPVPAFGTARSVILADPQAFAGLAVRVKTAGVPLESLGLGLETPDGTQVDLLRGLEGCCGSELDITFDDASSAVLQPHHCLNADQGLHVRPDRNATLGRVRSPQPAGYWILTATSSHPFHGLLQLWSLAIMPELCAQGFTMEAGAAVGDGEVTGAGAGTPVGSCESCALLCLSDAACRSYGCSHSALRCSLHLGPDRPAGLGGDHVLCARRDCGPPAPPDYMIPHNCSHRYGGACGMTCRPPYVGAPAAVCTSDGTWHYAGTCVPISCGAPRMDYVDFGGCGHRYGGLCRPACQTGYTGAPTAVCGSDGSWTYEGACERIRCSPPFMEHVDFSDCEFGYGAACHPVCVSGYTGNPAAVCTATGRWDYLGSCQPDVPTYENAVAFPVPAFGTARSVILADPQAFAGLAVRVKTAGVPLESLGLGLETPDGTQVDLLRGLEGCSGSEPDITFDDASSAVLRPHHCLNADQGLHVRPDRNATLGRVRSPQPAGYWTLSVNSSHAAPGLLQLWSLIATVHPYSGFEAFMFGEGRAGQLGLGNRVSLTRPVGLQLPHRAKISGMAVGGAHTLLLAEGGTVFVFGGNADGQLGLGDTADRDAPHVLPAPGGHPVTAVAAGRAHSAVLAGGRVWTFGANAAGQLGLGDTAARRRPHRVAAAALAAVTSAALGAAHSAFVAGGALWVCGSNSYGQLGLARTAPVLSPTRLPLPGPVTGAALGGAHTAVAAGGALYLCGANDWGQLGFADPRGAFELRPWAPPDGALVEAFACGAAHTAVLAGGAAYVFGRNHRGQLGLGPGAPEFVAVATPVAVPGRQRVTALALGGDRSAFLAGGRVYACGANAQGQLGVGDRRDRAAPAWVPAPNGQQVTHVAVGGAHGAFVAEFTFTPTPTASATPLPTATPTGTPTTSRSVSPSPSGTAPPSRTPSATATPFTASLTATATRSQTMTGPATPTATPSSDMTLTASTSPSAAQTRTPSATPTVPPTTTATTTASPSAVATASPTRSSTGTRSALLTPTTTATATPTSSRLYTVTPTPSSSPTRSPPATGTASASPTVTASPSALVTLTATPSPSLTPADTPTPTASSTSSHSPTVPPTPTVSPTGSRTQTTPPSPTATHTASQSATSTGTPTATPSARATSTSTASPSQAQTASQTPSATSPITDTLTGSSSPSDVATATNTRSSTGTRSACITTTASTTTTPTPSRLYTLSATPSASATASPRPTSSASPTATVSASLSAVFTPTSTLSPSSTTVNTASQTASATPSHTPTASRVFTLTASPTPTSTRTPSITSTPSHLYTPTPTVSSTGSPTASPSPTSSPSATPTPTQTPSQTCTASPNPTLTLSPSRTLRPTSTATLSRTASTTATSTSLPTTTPSPTSTAELPQCSEHGNRTNSNGHVVLQAAANKCMQAMNMGQGSSSLFNRRVVIRLLALDGNLILELVSGCGAGAGACRLTYTPADVEREDVLKAGAGGIETFVLYEPPAAAGNRRARDGGGFSIDVVVVYTASSLLLLILLLALLLLLLLVVFFAQRYARRLAALPLTEDYFARHPRGMGFRLVWPRSSHWWRLVGLAAGLYLACAGVAWYVLLHLMSSREAPGFPLAVVGLAVAAAGLALAALATARALRDRVPHVCPGCRAPASRWRFLGVYLAPLPEDPARVRKGHRRCMRCVHCGRAVVHDPWPGGPGHRPYHRGCWERHCADACGSPAYAEAWCRAAALTPAELSGTLTAAIAHRSAGSFAALLAAHPGLDEAPTGGYPTARHFAAAAGAVEQLDALLALRDGPLDAPPAAPAAEGDCLLVAGLGPQENDLFVPQPLLQYNARPVYVGHAAGRYLYYYEPPADGKTYHPPGWCLGPYLGDGAPPLRLALDRTFGGAAADDADGPPGPRGRRRHTISRALKKYVKGSHKTLKGASKGAKEAAEAPDLHSLSDVTLDSAPSETTITPNSPTSPPSCSAPTAPSAFSDSDTVVSADGPGAACAPLSAEATGLRRVPQALSLLQAAAASGDAATVQCAVAAYRRRFPECTRWQYEVPPGLWDTFPGHVQQKIAQAVVRGLPGLSVDHWGGGLTLDLVNHQYRMGGVARRVRARAQTMVHYRAAGAAAGGWGVTSSLGDVPEWDEAFAVAAGLAVAAFAPDRDTLARLSEEGVVDACAWQPPCKDRACRALTGQDPRGVEELLEGLVAAAVDAPDGVAGLMPDIRWGRAGRRGDGRGDRGGRRGGRDGDRLPAESRFADGLCAPSQGKPGERFWDDDYACDVGTLAFCAGLPDNGLGLRFALPALLEMCLETLLKAAEAARQRLPLSAQHVAPVYVYTYELPDDSEQIYSAMNRAMRTRDAAGIELWRPLIWQVDRALQHLPPHRGRLYRGINVRFSEADYRPGQHVCWPALSSASCEKAVAADFVKGDEGSLFFIQCKEGRLISQVCPPTPHLRVPSPPPQLHGAPYLWSGRCTDIAPRSRPSRCRALRLLPRHGMRRYRANIDCLRK